MAPADLFRQLVIVALGVAATGCASVQQLPPSAGDVDFHAPDAWMSEHAFDPVGYQVTYEFPPGVEALSQALSAAKAGVAYAGFNMVTVGEDGLSVLASKGPDISRNIEVVGIYLHQSESGFLAKIFVKGESLGLYWERELGYVQDQIIAGIDLFLASDKKLQTEDSRGITAQE